MNNTRIQYKIISPVGTLYLVASDKGLQGIFFDKQDIPVITNLNTDSLTTKILLQTQIELNEYFAGERKDFSIPLDIVGTEFQKKVWSQLRKISYGKTKSYKQVAEQLQSKAIRAVGNANGKNPLCIIIPCHRVIAHDGKIGGYTSGIEVKRKLLELEGIRIPFI